MTEITATATRPRYWAMMTPSTRSRHGCGRISARPSRLLFEEELEAAIGRCRYGRGAGRTGYRHDHRSRHLVGTFGTKTVQVPRARITEADGSTTESRSRALPRHQHLTK